MGPHGTADNNTEKNMSYWCSLDNLEPLRIPDDLDVLECYLQHVSTEEFDSDGRYVPYYPALDSELRVYFEGLADNLINKPKNENPYFSLWGLKDDLAIIKRKIQAAWWVRGWNHSFHVAADNLAEGFWNAEYEEETGFSYPKFFHAPKRQSQKLTAAQIVEREDNKILELLDRNGGNKAATARELGLAPSTFKGRLGQIELRRREGY
jgi:hypothetical protein